MVGVQFASRLAARFGPQWVMAYSTAVLVSQRRAIIVFDQLGFGLWGTVIPLFVFMTACGFTFPCVQVLALDRHGKAAGTAASLIGATNFGIAGVISPVVGWISRDAGITATTMAAVMAGCAVIGVLALWLDRAAAHGRAAHALTQRSGAAHRLQHGRAARSGPESRS